MSSIRTQYAKPPVPHPSIDQGLSWLSRRDRPAGRPPPPRSRSHWRAPRPPGAHGQKRRSDPSPHRPPAAPFGDRPVRFPRLIGRPRALGSKGVRAARGAFVLATNPDILLRFPPVPPRPPPHPTPPLPPLPLAELQPAAPHFSTPALRNPGRQLSSEAARRRPRARPQ